MQATQRKIEYRPSQAPPKRIVKMDGNVAYINTGFAKQRVRQPKAAAKPEVKPAKRDHKGVASTIIVIFVAFCALALLVSRYAAVCMVGSENDELKGEINALNVRIEALKVDMELQDDLEYVRDKAVNVLGMMYPEQRQRIYLDMS